MNSSEEAIRLYLLVLIIILGLLFLGFDRSIVTNKEFYKEKENRKIFPFKIGERVYLLMLATNEKEWTQGLMFLRKPVDFDGMIFIFPDKKIRSFWNKNTFLDLEIYWFDNEKLLGKNSLPSIEKSKKIIILTSPGPVNRVVEIIK